MTTADLDQILQAVRDEVRVTVNGKIDKVTKLVEEHNAKHEADMCEIKPIIVEYKERVAARTYAKKIGDGVKWTAGVLTALAVVWAALVFAAKTLWPK